MYELLLKNLDTIVVMKDKNGSTIIQNKDINMLEHLGNGLYIDRNSGLYYSKKVTIIYHKNEQLFLEEYKDITKEYKDITELGKTVEELEKDPLTGLANRGIVDKKLEHIAQDYNTHVIALLDIDDFKLVNDTKGHQYGDFVLKELASVMSSSMRKTDFIGRYGGEEFIIILSTDNFTSAVERLNDLRERIEEEFKETIHPITVSIGVSGSLENVTPEHQLKLADEALYYCKNNGKNMVKYYGVLEENYEATEDNINKQLLKGKR